MIETIVFSITIIVLIIATVFDIKRRIIPNFIPIILILLGIIRILNNGNTKETIYDILTGLILSSVVCLLCRIVSKDGFGMGDVKLIVALGFLLGFKNTSLVLLATCIFSFVFGVIQLLIFRRKKATTYPFAPFVMIGTVVWIIGYYREAIF